jgi:hypothetical protein
MTSPGLPLPSSLIGGPGCFSVSAGAAKSPDLGGASVANESNRPVDARVLILDEPTATLSDADIERILGILKSLRAQDRSILYITHRLGEVFELCDSVTVLRNGQHVATEPVNQDAQASRRTDARTFIRRHVSQSGGAVRRWCSSGGRRAERTKTSWAPAAAPHRDSTRGAHRPAVPGADCAADAHIRCGWQGGCRGCQGCSRNQSSESFRH